MPVGAAGVKCQLTGNHSNVFEDSLSALQNVTWSSAALAIDTERNITFATLLVGGGSITSA